MQLLEQCGDLSSEGKRCQLLRGHLCMHQVLDDTGDYRWSLGFGQDSDDPCERCPHASYCEHRQDGC